MDFENEYPTTVQDDGSGTRTDQDAMHERERLEHCRLVIRAILVIVSLQFAMQDRWNIVGNVRGEVTQLEFHYDHSGRGYRTALNDLAELHGPDDSFTAVAVLLVTIFTGLLIFPVILVSPLVRFVVRLFAMGTFGIAAIPLDVIWQATSIVLVFSSLAWVKYPWSRPILLIPGLLFATFGTIWVTLTTSYLPMVRAYRLAACDTWPSSYLVATKILEDRKAGLVP